MKDQKYKLLSNHDQPLVSDTEDSCNGVEETYFAPIPDGKLHRNKQRRTILYLTTGLMPIISKSYGPRRCGNSSEEAIKNGCVLDFIPGAWVHRDCYDEDLERDFLDYAGRHWYTDPEGKHELSEDLMRQTGGPNPVYVSTKYHDTHCAYTWRKLHRAILRGTPIDSQIGPYAHTKHCSKALSITRDAEKSQFKAPARFFTIFTYCELPQNFHQPKEDWEEHGSENKTY
ncbi:hypothetical protein SCUP234_03294 [Seiridium cupressi]